MLTAPRNAGPIPGHPVLRSIDPRGLDRRPTPLARSKIVRIFKWRCSCTI